MSAPRFTGTFELQGAFPHRTTALLLALSSVMLLALVIGHDTVTPPALAAFMFYAVMTAMTLMTLLGPSLPVRVAVSVNDKRDLLMVKGRVRPHTFVAATAESLAVGTRVTLYGRDGAVMRLVGDAQNAAALLEALLLPRESMQSSASRIETMRPPLVAFLLALLVPLAVVHTRADSLPTINLVLAAFVSLGLPLAAIALPWWSRVTVGNDGIAMRTLFSRRFIRIEELHAVERANERVVLVLQSGERVVAMRGATFRKPGPAHIDEAALLETRILEALRQHQERTRERPAANVPQLSRGARSASEWVAALRALGAGATAYRDSAASPDVLASTVEDAGASDDVRVGAAVALRVSGDPNAARHIRVAAAATAEPDLRGALEGVLAEDEATLEARVEKMRILSRPAAERTR